MLRLSVIICTLNRAHLLPEAVGSVASQTLDPALFEIIVVNNGSTDSTQDVVSHLMRKIPNLRYFYEPKLGLSNARNRGTEEARGEVVAFMDDDALADPGWTKEMCGVYEVDPDVGAAGGRIDLIWPNQPPEWLPENLEGYYGKFDLGRERLTIVYPLYPFGSTMSIKRQLLLDIGGFSTRLGRKGNNLISGEETEIFYQLSQRGIKVMYEPGALVRHRVEMERLSRRWVIRRAFAGGRSSVKLDCHRQGRGTRSQQFRNVFNGSRHAAAYGRRCLFLLFGGKADTPALVLSGAHTAYWWGYTLESLSVAIGLRGNSPERPLDTGVQPDASRET